MGHYLSAITDSWAVFLSVSLCGYFLPTGHKSRKIIGWQVYEEENSALAGELLRDLCHREGIQPEQLILHSDNGSPMKGSTMLATLTARCHAFV
ncbi:MAG: hypothetical protein Q8L02_05385 [Candidatus Nitrotoga sp.]|nr:hypothetical protein [Candidatus Nitrotoga sp.]